MIKIYKNNNVVVVLVVISITNLAYPYTALEIL